MEKGFNTDIVHMGQTYHVQTEDWGDQNPFVVTRVYKSGAVLVSLKTPYEKLLAVSFHRDLSQALKSSMREQHQKVLDQLSSGRLFEVVVK